MKVYIVFRGGGMADPIIEVVCATEELAKAAMEELVQETARNFLKRLGVLSLTEEERRARRLYYVEEVLAEEEQRARRWYYVEEVDVRT